MDIDILSPLPETQPVRATEGLLLILRVGAAPVGRLFVPPGRANLVLLDLARHLPGAVSSSRFREARLMLGLPDRAPRELSLDEVRETFRMQQKLPAPAYPRPAVSVVICTRGRRDHLVRCLVSVFRLTYPDYEVVLVDNNDPGEGVFDIATRFPCRYVKEIRPGLSRSRNLALQECRGEIVAFTDDDVEVEMGWLDGLVREFQDPKAQAVTGPILPRELATRGQEWFEELAMGPSWLCRMTFDPGDYSPGLSPGIGTNMAFRRSFLQTSAGFDPLLGPGTPTCGGEDQDALLRVLSSGGRVVYTPEAVVRHFHCVDLDEAHAVAFHHTASRTALLARLLHRDRTQFRPILKHLLRRFVGRTPVPSEDYGLPRARLPLPLLLLANLYGPVTFMQSLWAAQRPEPGRGES